MHLPPLSGRRERPGDGLGAPHIRCYLGTPNVWLEIKPPLPLPTDERSSSIQTIAKLDLASNR